MTKPKSYKTTEAHFKVFKAECEYWSDRFSLRSWDVHFQHKNDEENPDWIAWRKASWSDRVATIGLSVDWRKNKSDEKQVGKSAFHEVCELLLYRLETEALVDTCPTQRDNIGEQRHAIIRRLEHAVWLPDWNRRHGKK